MKSLSPSLSAHESPLQVNVAIMFRSELPSSLRLTPVGIEGGAVMNVLRWWR